MKNKTKKNQIFCTIVTFWSFKYLWEKKKLYCGIYDLITPGPYGRSKYAKKKKKKKKGQTLNFLKKNLYRGSGTLSGTLSGPVWPYTSNSKKIFKKSTAGKDKLIAWLHVWCPWSYLPILWNSRPLVQRFRPWVGPFCPHSKKVIFKNIFLCIYSHWISPKCIVIKSTPYFPLLKLWILYNTHWAGVKLFISGWMTNIAVLWICSLFCSHELLN